METQNYFFVVDSYYNETIIDWTLSACSDTLSHRWDFNLYLQLAYELRRFIYLCQSLGPAIRNDLKYQWNLANGTFKIRRPVDRVLHTLL